LQRIYLSAARPSSEKTRRSPSPLTEGLALPGESHLIEKYSMILSKKADLVDIEDRILKIAFFSINWIQIVAI
jgi:hypothetical protein